MPLLYEALCFLTSTARSLCALSQLNFMDGCLEAAGPVEAADPGGAAVLCPDKGFQGDAVGDHQRATILRIRRCFLKPANIQLTVSREVPIIWPISS
jgi:hypothetical protein